MKKDIHPEYREVLFHDISVDEYFLLRSTLRTDKTKEWEGKEYPYYTVEVSSASHPFYTGKQKIIDTGMVPELAAGPGAYSAGYQYVPPKVVGSREATIKELDLAKARLKELQAQKQQLQSTAELYSPTGSRQ